MGEAFETRNSVVKCEQVEFSYADRPREDDFILRNLNFEVKSGEFVLLQGDSGCGKTTLLKLLGGLLRPSHGSIVIDGTDISKFNAAQSARLRQKAIGFIFQEANLDEQRTVLQNILLPLYFGKQSLNEGRRRALELLKVLGLEKYKLTLVSQLSGGQRQRVAAVRALINTPLLLLADEPTAHLDNRNSLLLYQALQELRKVSPTTVVMTSHYLPPSWDTAPLSIYQMDNNGLKRC